MAELLPLLRFIDPPAMPVTEKMVAMLPIAIPQPATIRESDGKMWSSVLHTQRKINHLLTSGGMGRSFRYNPSFNLDVGFLEGDDVFMTEKYDGTTMQATANDFFKRFDNLKKGSKKKFLANEKERYRLEKLDLDSPSNQYMKLAVQPYLENFRCIETGFCVYFEACGPKIGTRYKSSFIRVFDISQVGDSDTQGNHGYLPFETTVSLCKKWGLPCVAHRRQTLILQNIMDELATRPQYNDVEGVLEGYVIRDVKAGNCRIAKVRCDDLSRIEYSKIEEN